mgnify:CR=1 FL=1
MLKQQEVIIIGAPRSGTNMLRDILTGLDGVDTWPCDEINYIWRHKNVRYPSDEFPVELARPEVVKYIRGKFEALRRKTGAQIIVEKTCANALRVSFVDKILPEAKHIHIYRDGIDAVGSAMLRWSASLDLQYILAKARYVPLTDLPYYGTRYLWSRLYRFISPTNRLAFWGPVLNGMDEILKTHTLEEICALQWQRSLDNADAAFEKMPSDKVFRIRYEDFVSNPDVEFAAIADYLGLEIDQDQLSATVSRVSNKSVGKGRASLSADVKNRVSNLVGETLDRLGYNR